MTRPFSPLDSFRLRAQQASGAALELETEILVGHSPLRQALQGYWRLHGGQVQTLVLSHGAAGATDGFVQCRVRSGCPVEADLTFVAPALHAVEGAALAWQRLIAGACQHLGGLGVERVFVAAAEDDRVALQVFRQQGFTVWTNDVVFVLDSGETQPCADELELVPPEPDVDYRVRSLVHEGLPQSVRASTPELGADWCSQPIGGTPGPTHYRAWIGAKGEVLGAWRIVGGETASWMRIASAVGSDAEALVRSALGAVWADERLGGLPVYSAARGYEPELNLALRELGFEPELRRFHLVKHTTARVIAPAWRDKKVAEAAFRRAPTSSAQLHVVGVTNNEEPNHSRPR